MIEFLPQQPPVAAKQRLGKDVLVELLGRMVCSQVVGRERARTGVQGVHKRRRRRTDRKDILEQYRKLRMVLPNMSKHGKVTRVSGKIAKILNKTCYNSSAVLSRRQLFTLKSWNGSYGGGWNRRRWTYRWN